MRLDLTEEEERYLVMAVRRAARRERKSFDRLKEREASAHRDSLLRATQARLRVAGRVAEKVARETDN